MEDCSREDGHEDERYFYNGTVGKTISQVQTLCNERIDEFRFREMTTGKRMVSAADFKEVADTFFEYLQEKSKVMGRDDDDLYFQVYQYYKVFLPIEI